MYQRSFSGGRETGSRGRRPYSGGRFSYSSNRGGYGGGRGRSNGGGGGRGASKLAHMDPMIFVKKASTSEPVAEYVPKHTNFAEFNVEKQILTNIARSGYTSPTPIQDQAIEPILQGNDLIGTASTGTGKTAAFLIPIIDKIIKDEKNRAIIIAPTRELVAQIHTETRNLTVGMRIYSTQVIGGMNIHRQIHELRRFPHIVIATPGRLKDLIERRSINLNSFSVFVLDEVDMMVDIGFINDIKYFVNLLPDVRQSLFFSATLPPKVNEILRAFVRNPIQVSVAKNQTSANVDQDIVRVTDKSQKTRILADILKKPEFRKVLIFGRTKHGIERLSRDLTSMGFSTGSLHGNKNQSQRKRILDRFRMDDIKILLATDVASRGLDIKNVTHVINYDLPETYEDYIHRIGRTGRANQKGLALTFID